MSEMKFLFSTFFAALGAFILCFIIIGFITFSESEKKIICKKPVKFGRHLACMVWSFKEDPENKNDNHD